MSKSLRSMTEDEKRVAIDRRLQEKTGGLGFWAAVAVRGVDTHYAIKMIRNKQK